MKYCSKPCKICDVIKNYEGAHPVCDECGGTHTVINDAVVHPLKEPPELIAYCYDCEEPFFVENPPASSQGGEVE